MIRIESKHVGLDGTTAVPRLVSFPIGVPPDAEDLELNLLYKTSAKGQKRRQVSAVTDGLVYSGCDYGEYSVANNTVQFAIGRLDESKGIMTIVPADHAFIMRPEVEQVHVAPPPRLSTLTTTERRDMRTEEFGSRKKQRAQQVAASNTISAQNILGASAVESAMISKIKDKATTEGAEISATDKAINENRELYLPKYDLNATEAANIYPLSSLIASEVNDALEVYCEQIFDTIATSHDSDSKHKSKKLKANILADKFSVYLQSKEGAPEGILRGLSKLKENAMSKDDAAAAASEKIEQEDKVLRKTFKKHSRRAVLMLFMVRFFQAINSSVSKFRPDAHINELVDKVKAPQAIFNYLISSFTSHSKFKGKVSFTKIDNDKLKIHMIALALHINNFTSCSLSVIARDLKLVEKVLADLAREMGCKVVKDKDSKELVSSLTAPLVFPAMKRPIKK